MLQDRTSALKNALWGMFVADALAMPVHWYYNRDNIKAEFEGGITKFEAPRHPHPEAFMVGMTYMPDLDAARQYGRPFDILHDHARFYQTSFSTLEFTSDARESEHGNATTKPHERYHYHHGLGRGENTLNAHLARVLMRCVIKHERYDPNAFLSGMIEHMTTPGRNRDPYSEIFLRRWFENFASGLPPHACAEQQREIWSIGSHGGLHRALIVSTLANDTYQGLGFAIEHQMLTHRSENVAASLGILTPLLHQLIRGEDPVIAFRAAAKSICLPKIKGEELFRQYREAQGPGNIPKSDMWRLHVDLADEGFDIDAHLELGDDAVIRKLISTACYPEHGLPLMLYCALSAGADTMQSLLLNANAGGDNVNRGLSLGLLMGAAMGVPDELKTGLADYESIAGEIDAFAALASAGNALI